MGRLYTLTSITGLHYFYLVSVGPRYGLPVFSFSIIRADRPLGFGRTHGNTPFSFLNYSLERVINGVVVVCDVVVMFDLLLVVLWWRYSLVVHTGFGHSIETGSTLALPHSYLCLSKVYGRRLRLARLLVDVP